MLIKTSTFTSLICGYLAMASCAPQAGPTSEMQNAVSFRPDGSKISNLPAYTLMPMWGGVHVLTACSASGTLMETYELDIGNNFDVKKLSDKIKKKSDGSDVDHVTGSIYRTAWDIRPRLASGKYIKLSIHISANKIRFQPNGYAITSNDLTASNLIICPSGTWDDKNAEVIVNYKAGLTTPLGYNVGIIFEDHGGGTGDYDVPIHIDPTIKNNG